MPILEDAREENACQLRAKGKTCKEAYEEAGFAAGNNNGSRFFRKGHIKARVAEIMRRAALLAELDEGFVLRGLKTVALQTDANLDDYFTKDANGRRVTTIAEVSRDKMANLGEVTVEEFAEKQGGENGAPVKWRAFRRRTKVALKPTSAAIKALELIGQHIGMWPRTSSIELAGKDGGPIRHEMRRAADLSDDELATIAMSESQ